MCGIFGYFDQFGKVMPNDVFLQMGAAIAHRGPDGLGVYHPDKGIGLGNQRLAILDTEGGGAAVYFRLWSDRCCAEWRDL